jgi:hypothetical protein
VSIIFENLLLPAPEGVVWGKAIMVWHEGHGSVIFQETDDICIGDILSEMGCKDTPYDIDIATGAGAWKQSLTNGIYVFEFELEDLGPSDSPYDNSHEYGLGIKSVEPIKPETWKDFVRGDWPWDSPLRPEDM